MRALAVSAATRLSIPLDKATVAKGALLVLVLVLGLDLRLTAVSLTEVYVPIRVDAQDYYHYARNLVEHGVYSKSPGGDGAAAPAPDFVRPPGFPLFAALFHDADVPTFIERVANAQAAISALSGLVLFLVGLRLLGYWPALAATLLYAISPHVVASNLYFLSESLTVSLIVGVMGALAAALATGRWYWWLGVGLLLGCATLTRSYVTYFPLLLAPFLIAHFGWRCWHAAAALLVGFALLLGPWNAAIHLSGGDGASRKMLDTIHHGMYPDVMYQGDPQSLGYPYRFDPRADEIAADLPTLLGELRARAAEDPLTYARWFLVGKPITMWRWGLLQGFRDVYVYEVWDSPYDYLPHFQLTYRVSHWSHWPLVVLGLVGCLAVWLPQARRVFTGWQLPMLRVLSLFLIYSTAVHMVGAPFPRYMVPQKAPLFVMAMAVVVAAARVWSARGAEARRD